MTKYLNIALVYVADVCNIEGGWARNTPVGMNLAALSFMLFGTFVRVRSICTAPARLNVIEIMNGTIIVGLTSARRPNASFFNVPMMPYPATKRLKAQAITDAEPYTVIPSADNVTAVIQTCFNNSVPNVSHILDGKWGLAKVYARRLNRQIHPDITSLLFKPRLLDIQHIWIIKDCVLSFSNPILNSGPSPPEVADYVRSRKATQQSSDLQFDT
ncbi:hypothetical protein B0H13DRAFT_1906132 [Mycena leptocephala]|nr:hypothetical protein B0H13DRAFT_1908598 [Mycena leptocephala]KAJ7849595.1 hypothetical protein B0H13DRAFT_1906132 [Mycena leptocephala]